MCMSPISIKKPMSDLNIWPDWQRFIQVPCGKCDECRVSHAKEWGVRCMCQLLSMPYHEQANSWFVTLTFDNDHVGLCWNARSAKRLFTLFIKKLRKHFSGVKMKYFYAYELGTVSLRPHFHMILFNCPISILKNKRVSQSGCNLWESPEIAKIWGYGFVSVGEVTLESCAYTARYSMKKNTTDCYMRCSQGFGKQFFYDHMSDIIFNGVVSVPVNGKIVKHRIPKYYLKLYRKFLNDDDKYSKFIKWKYKNTSKYIDEIKKQNGLFAGSSYILRQSIGLPHPSVEYESTKKRIIKNALGDLYSMRDLQQII